MLKDFVDGYSDPEGEQYWVIIPTLLRVYIIMVHTLMVKAL